MSAGVDTRPRRWALAGGIVVILVAGAIASSVGSPPRGDADADLPASAPEASGGGGAAPPVKEGPAAHAPSAPRPAPPQWSRPERAPGGHTPTAPPIPPEAQPRAFLVQPIAGPLGEGWDLKDLRAGEDGLRLAAAPEPLNPRRVGRLESPPVELDFPANFLSPLWRADQPPGAAITIEVAVSPDGREFGPWYELAPDADAALDIRETYPDGRPNPNYGFTPVGMLTTGLATFTFFKYRLTLASEGATPTVSELRFFYQDTTLGKDRVIEL